MFCLWLLAHNIVLRSPAPTTLLKTASSAYVIYHFHTFFNQEHTIEMMYKSTLKQKHHIATYILSPHITTSMRHCWKLNIQRCRDGNPLIISGNNRPDICPHLTHNLEHDMQKGGYSVTARPAGRWRLDKCMRAVGGGR